MKKTVLLTIFVALGASCFAMYNNKPGDITWESLLNNTEKCKSDIVSWHTILFPKKAQYKRWFFGLLKKRLSVVEKISEIIKLLEEKYKEANDKKSKNFLQNKIDDLQRVQYDLLNETSLQTNKKLFGGTYHFNIKLRPENI